MGAVIFDFDSTLVPTESLEDLLGMALDGPAADTAAARERIAEITRAGMDGRLSFLDSLQQRLDIARPTKHHTDQLVEDLRAAVPDDTRQLVHHLHAGGHQVWIVSGGFLDLLRPVGESLGIPAARIHGVQTVWDGDAFAGLDRTNGFAESKIAGARALKAGNAAWEHPAIGVGDGMTDYALFEAGLVDHFIAFTAFARRDAVLATGCPQAASMADLERRLETLLS